MARYRFITAQDRAKLLANGARNARGGRAFDPRPVVLLFTPDGLATRLLTELDPADPDRAFGLCGLGLSTPELGYVSLPELAALRGRLGLPIERDRTFRPNRALSAYATAARAAGRITAWYRNTTMHP